VFWRRRRHSSFTAFISTDSELVYRLQTKMPQNRPIFHVLPRLRQGQGVQFRNSPTFLTFSTYVSMCEFISYIFHASILHKIQYGGIKTKVVLTQLVRHCVSTNNVTDVARQCHYHIRPLLASLETSKAFAVSTTGTIS